MSDKDQASLRGKVLRGVGWAVAMRWVVRALGLVSTIVLARLLEPEDFGIISMAVIVAGLVEVLFELGIGYYLIQKAEIEDEDYHTAWTIRMLQGLAATLLIVLVTPLGIDYFNEPKLGSLLPWLALMPLIKGLENIGVVNFVRDIDLAKEFRFNVIKKIGSFTITIGSAIVLQNYWALVIGALSGATIGVVLSYVMHPFRPRLSLRRARAVYSFSIWILVHHIANYAQTRIDRMIIGGRADADLMGAYTLASEASELPTNEVVMPMGRALLPGLSKIQQEPERMRSAFLKAFGLIAIVTFPISVGMALTAEPLIHVLLGSKWGAAVEPFRILSLVGLAFSIRYPATILMIAMGRVKLLSLLGWLQVILFVLLSITWLRDAGIVEIAGLRLALALFLMLLTLGYVTRVGVARIGDLAGHLVRPFLASGLMMLAVIGLNRYLDLGLVAGLVGSVLVGALVYMGAVFALWRLAGRPESAESIALEIAVPRIKVLLKRA